MEAFLPSPGGVEITNSAHAINTAESPASPRRRWSHKHSYGWTIPGWIIFALHTLSYFYYGDDFTPSWGLPIAIIVAIIIIACGTMGRSVPLIVAGVVTPFIIWVIMVIGVVISVMLLFLQALVNVMSTAITGSPAIEGTLAT